MIMMTSLFIYYYFGISKNERLSIRALNGGFMMFQSSSAVVDKVALSELRTVTSLSSTLKWWRHSHSTFRNDVTQLRSQAIIRVMFKILNDIYIFLTKTHTLEKGRTISSEEGAEIASTAFFISSHEENRLKKHENEEELEWVLQQLIYLRLP